MFIGLQMTVNCVLALIQGNGTVLHRLNGKGFDLSLLGRCRRRKRPLVGFRVVRIDVDINVFKVADVGLMRQQADGGAVAGFNILDLNNLA